MSNIQGDGSFLIEHEPHAACELCGTIRELRPYGPDGKRICYPCGLLDIEGTSRRMAEFIRRRKVVIGHKALETIKRFAAGGTTADN